MTARLLIIEDDLPLSETLCSAFIRHNFQVALAHNAMTGLQKSYAFNPDIVLLDIMLPDMDGWQLCSRLRETSEVGIIILTALAPAENIIKGLNLGADDYIIKPVGLPELLARIRALLRRMPPSDARTCNINQDHFFMYDHLTIDFNKHEVMVDGKPVDLSPTEFRLLSLLVRHRGRMLPHEYLLREVWGPGYGEELDYVRLYISYLRHKLERDPANPSLIHSEWGEGYQFG